MDRRTAWAEVQLLDIANLSAGNTPSKKITGNYGGYIPFVKPPELQNRRINCAPEMLSEQGSENARLLPENAVLVSCIGNLGKTGISGCKIAFNQQINAIEAYPGIDPGFIFYQAQSQNFRNQLEQRATATTISIVNKGNFSTIKVWVPPTNEQHRIVAKIEELFSELDKGIESLKTAREQLKVYRQALLKHAFEGKLTEQWRKDNADKLETADQLLERIKQEREARYQQQLKAWKAAVKQWEAAGQKGKRPKKPRTLKPISHNIELIDQDSELEDLPKGWLKLQVNDCLLEPPSNGRSVKDRVGGFPVLRLTALKPLKIDIAAHKNGDWEREQAKDYIIREGDFLLSRGNGSKNLVGLGKLVPPLEFEVAYPDTMVRLRVISGCLIDEYLAQVWNSRVVRRQIEKNARTTAGIYKINQKHIAEFKLPLCSIEEQKQIVDLLSENLPLLDQMEKDIGKGLDTSEALRQSILKKAFSGQLVPQDPNDEPASALLERIAKEKEAAGAKVKKTRR